MPKSLLPPVPAAELKELRELLGLTQEEAALIFAVSPNTWARWERGVLGMHPGHVKSIQRVQARVLRSRDKVWILGTISRGLMREARVRQGSNADGINNAAARRAEFRRNRRLLRRL